MRYPWEQQTQKKASVNSSHRCGLPDLEIGSFLEYQNNKDRGVFASYNFEHATMNINYSKQGTS